MTHLGSSEALHFLLIIIILLATARLLGELMKKIGLPSIIGELLGGLLLGPSLLGAIYPQFFEVVFSAQKQADVAFDGVSRLSILLLLFVAGMEVKLDTIKQRGRPAAKISFFGIFFPFSVGFLATWFFFPQIFGMDNDNRLVTSLFIGTALSITALSVMAKILLDLDLIKSRFGNLLLTASMVNAFIGWMLFSVVITLADLQAESKFSTLAVLVIILAYTFALLTVGRKLFDRAFAYCNTHLSKPGAELSLAIILCLLGSLFTEWIGITAILGAFLMGIAVGDSRNLSQRSKQSVHDLIAYVFSPLFFVSVGLRVNFFAHFDWLIVCFVLAISMVGKVSGGYVGARLSGFKKNKALAVGFGMNARGSQEILLGLVAFQAGIIDEEIMVGLLVMTFVSILLAGPLIKLFLRRHEDREPVSASNDSAAKQPVAPEA